MNSYFENRGRRMIQFKRDIAGLGFALVLSAQAIWAQTETPLAKETVAKRTMDTSANFKTQTFYLTNISQTVEANEIITAIRNMLTPYDKVFLVPSQNAVIVYANQDDLQLTQKLIADLDRPRKSYRLIYTLTESDAGKRIGVQHFALIVVSGQRTTMKQGSRIPVGTGMGQFTYYDVGLNFDATLDESVNGVRLRTKAEQSSIAEGTDPQRPVVRQTTLEGTGILTPGKPLVLGSLDIPGSTRHQDVEVVMEVVK